ncbi:Zinc finger CCHC-type [Trinorchestia longiramus]|nr:Zinc finger CCHC-type [Trinorchestia longiramus]
MGSQLSVQGNQQGNQNDLTVQEVMVDIHQSGKPWQCFHCQRFGHNAVNCRAAPRCVVCSGAHNSRECPSQAHAHVAIAVEPHCKLWRLSQDQASKRSRKN